MRTHKHIRFFYKALGQHVILAYCICTLLFLGSCGSSKDFYSIPAEVSERTFNAVIEIPAGSNAKYEYHPTQKKFVIDQENGKDRIIDFLPYPANYGFIPSTLSKSETGGDGDALDVLVLSASETTGTIVEIIPIALLRLMDDGEKDYKIIAVPQDQNHRIITATTYAGLRTNYSKLLDIIELWFLNYNPKDTSSVEDWGDEQEAIEEIARHLKN